MRTNSTSGWSGAAIAWDPPGKPEGKGSTRRDGVKVSDRKWGSISESDYDDADEYCRACLIDLNPSGEDKTKARCKLPVYEPKGMGGALNRNAVHQAAAVLAGARGGVDAPDSHRRKAVRTLLELYRQLGEEPPESLT